MRSGIPCLALTVYLMEQHPGGHCRAFLLYEEPEAQRHSLEATSPGPILRQPGESGAAVKPGLWRSRLQRGCWKPTPELILGLPLGAPLPCLWQLLALGSAALEWEEGSGEGWASALRRGCLRLPGKGALRKPASLPVPG